MKKNYRIAEKGDTRKMAEFLASNGELPPPMVEPIESSRMAVGERIDLLGRAGIEAAPRFPAQGEAGKSAKVGRHPPGSLRLCGQRKTGPGMDHGAVSGHHGQGQPDRQ